MAKVYDRYFIQIKKSSKPVLVKKRKEFMELLLKTLSDDSEAQLDLLNKFGTSVVAKTANGSDVSVNVDGERVFKI